MTFVRAENWSKVPMGLIVVVAYGVLMGPCAGVSCTSGQELLPEGMHAFVGLGLGEMHLEASEATFITCLGWYPRPHGAMLAGANVIGCFAAGMLIRIRHGWRA